MLILIIESFCSFKLKGANGNVKGFPKEEIEHSFTVKKIPKIIIPYTPKVAAPNKNIILQTLIALTTSIEENTKEEIAVTEITITIIGETIPADTAASPIIIPPKIEIALPPTLGLLVSLSFKISNLNFAEKIMVPSEEPLQIREKELLVFVRQN